jgi:hypothetical protein
VLERGLGVDVDAVVTVRVLEARPVVQSYGMLVVVVRVVVIAVVMTEGVLPPGMDVGVIAAGVMVHEESRTGHRIRRGEEAEDGECARPQASRAQHGPAGRSTETSAWSHTPRLP